MNTKLSLLLLLLSLVVSCGKSDGGKSSDSSDREVSDSAIEIDSEDSQTGSTAQNSSDAPDEVVDNDAITFDTNIKMYKFTSKGRSKILAAAELIKEVVASPEFKKKVLNHKVNGKRTFVDNGGLTNTQIYQKILDASEKLTPGKDNTMDLEVELYTDNSSNTVGYTYPSTIRVWMNSKYFNKNTPALVTTNMMHEWLHKLGFKHDAKATATRKYSVPYAIGYMVRDMARAL